MSEEINVDIIVQDFIACSGDCTKCKASLKVLEVVEMRKYESYSRFRSFSFCVLLMQYKNELIERITKLLDNC